MNPVSDTVLERLERLHESVVRVIRGKAEIVDALIAALLARGHVLLEDVPGVGKTTLAQALARSLDLDFHRIQFTSDTLPSDIIGISVYRQDRGEFEFMAGPLFSNVVLADEINRAAPRTQSALLEAMSEHAVTVDKTRHLLVEPFFVVATQNPVEATGTYPLPESQLDRFLMRLEIGYPEPSQEKRLLIGTDRREMLAALEPMLDAAALVHLQHRVEQVHVADAVVDYVHAILTYTRGQDRFLHGLSPRAGLGLLRCARAWALLEGRDFTLPEDVQRVLPVVVPHRLLSGEDNSPAGHSAIAATILDAVPVP